VARPGREAALFLFFVQHGEGPVFFDGEAVARRMFVFLLSFPFFFFSTGEADAAASVPE